VVEQAEMQFNVEFQLWTRDYGIQSVVFSRSDRDVVFPPAIAQEVLHLLV
jgi:hypothetical protein